MRAMAAMLALAAGLLLGPAPGRAAGEAAGAFDYYVLALSWQPGWCQREGAARGAAACRPGAGRGFVLHGLWPQNERDWPTFCRTRWPDPPRRQTAAMADIFGSPGLAWYQWKKHGRCSGLPAGAYFDAVRAALASVVLPPLFDRLREELRVAPEVVEAAFLEANPHLSPEAVVVTCRDGMIHELRICLTRELAPRPCSASVGSECQRPARLPPPR
ncbi:MAG: ribonuclease T [Alphaproteobacteria bacterium]|nr:MAG: ribonuclease T [Alphaproteobacteria bacterium]